MEKYYFKPKLDEGVLYQKSGILTASAGGTEYQPVFPLGRTSENVKSDRIPCLIRRLHNPKSDDACMVEAVSMDSPEMKKKEWICMDPLLFKNATGFFLKNHAMAEMTGHCANFRKDQAIASIHIDFTASDGTMIDAKVSMAGIETAYGKKQNKSYPILTPGLIMGYVNILNIPKYAENRMILLLIQQHGLRPGDPVPAMNGKTYESVKTGCIYGLELWNAAMYTDAEGISLVSCRCVTDDILSSGGLSCTMKKSK